MAFKAIRVIGVVPARLGSTRLPEKILADIHGEPLVVHTVSGAQKSGAFDQVLVATDHEAIRDAVTRAGFETLMTSAQHPSGTARTAEVARTIAGDVFVNIQGDEPLVDSEALCRLASAFRFEESLEMATLSFPLTAGDEENPNAVKVVADARGDALYFSRSLIPFPRSRQSFHPWKHIGVYGYRRDTLLKLVSLPPCDLEQVESLEQLRALYYGIRIRLIQATKEAIGVDTQADLERVRVLLQRS